eukprot:gene3213-14708_t
MPSKPADTAKVCSYCGEAKGTHKCAGSPSTTAVGAGASGSADAACASGGGKVSSGGTTMTSTNLEDTQDAELVAALKAASSIASMSTMKAPAPAAELQQGRRQGGDDDSDAATAATGKARTSTSFPIPKTAHGHPHAEPLGPGVAVQLTGLKNKKELNGEFGIAGVEDPATGRWTVVMDDCNTSIRVKPGNIAVLPPQHRNKEDHLTCFVCLEQDGFVLPLGCSCRGGTGAHLSCSGQAADAKRADDPSGLQAGSTSPYDTCSTCGQNYTGITSAGLARRYFRRAGPLASTYDPSENNGEELPESALAHRILASALSQARLDDIAIVLQDAVLKMIADSPNVNKLHLIQQFAQLGGSLQNQGNFKRAIEVQSRALEDSIAFQGMADRETRQLMMNQGNAMRSVCNHEKSCTLLKQAWDLYKEHDGEDHIDTLNAQMNYASTLMHFSDHVLKAEELMRDCYTKHSRIYGAEHQRTLITATNLYLVLLRQSLSAAEATTFIVDIDAIDDAALRAATLPPSPPELTVPPPLAHAASADPDAPAPTAAVEGEPASADGLPLLAHVVAVSRLSAPTAFLRSLGFSAVAAHLCRVCRF